MIKECSNDLGLSLKLAGPQGPEGTSDLTQEQKDNINYIPTIKGNINSINYDLKSIHDSMNSLQETPESIKNKLQSLTEDNRLDASSIKNLPNQADISNLAKKDLTNIDDKDFLDKGVLSGLLQQDLADVDLNKLKDKGTDAGFIDGITINNQAKVKEIQLRNNLDLNVQNSVASISIADVYASKDLINVEAADLDKAIRLTNAYKQIAAKHSDTPTPAQVETSLLYLEETNNIVDWTQYNSDKFLYIAYQFNLDGESITQVLPPVTQNKAIIISIVGHSNNPNLILQPDGTDQVDGSLNPLTLTEKGIQGILIAEQLYNNYIWIPYPIMHDMGISVTDNKNNIHIGIKTLEFNGATLSTDASDNSKSIITIDTPPSSGNSMEFVDGLAGTTFTSTKIQSSDKSIRIANLNGIADITKGYSDHNEGIHVALGNDELINSKFGKSKMYFSDTKVKGGMFVYADMNTKSFILQDTDPQDDPNVSGGTTFIIGLYYEPNMDLENKITQDGKIELLLVDDSDNPILDTNSNPMCVFVDYKANDILKPELYIGECQIKAATRVHLKIIPKFQNEEIISVGANTQLLIQSIDKNESSGLALLSFMAYTGYNIRLNTKYYGYNSLNLASRLVFDVPLTDTGTEEIDLGENLYLNFQRNAKIGIENHRLTIRDDGTTIPVFSMTKLYDKLDSFNISGKSFKITTTLTNKDNAFRVALLEYKGALNIPPKPKVESYNNGSPVFTSGWQLVDSMFLAENTTQEDYTTIKTFDIPDNEDGLAIILYPEVSEIPTVLTLKDLEGDIFPWFTKLIITDNSPLSEKYMINHEYYYKSIVYTPTGHSALRYTVNSSETKIPFGVVSGGDKKVINDNSWHDAGSVDPNKTQGDIKFLVDGTVKMSYTVRLFNEQGTSNQVNMWISKVGQGNTFTEVPNSRISFSIENNRTAPKFATSKTFEFNVLANESYRILANSDKDDGFYLQSDLNGDALFTSTIVFNELTFKEKDIFDKTNEVRFIENGQEVYDKVLEYDVATGKMKVVNK